jgi:hypothetical protein
MAREDDGRSALERVRARGEPRGCACRRRSPIFHGHVEVDADENAFALRVRSLIEAWPLLIAGPTGA